MDCSVYGSMNNVITENTKIPLIEIPYWIEYVESYLDGQLGMILVSTVN